MEHLSPADLCERIEAGEAITIVDVREAEEIELCAISGALHIPLGDVPERCGELDSERCYAILCHHGVRSAHAAGFLETRGFSCLINIDGGIDRWAEEVDRSLTRY